MRTIVALLMIAPTLLAVEPRKPVEVAGAIDKIIDAKLTEAKVAATPQSDDAEFLRRVYLDITGRLPTPEKAKDFLDSKEADKRTRLVDDLLNDPNYAKHFANVWYDKIVPRIPLTKTIDTESLRAALVADFAINRPWSEQIGRIIQAEGVEGSNYLAFHRINGDMGGNPMANVNARMYTRLFLGLRMECAECHDSPNKAWKQEQYWGIAAFFGRATLDDKDKNNKKLVETTGYKTPKGSTFKLTPKADGSLTVHSEAWFNAGKAMPPKFLGGQAQSFSVGKPMLPALAEWTASPDNPYLAKATANRWWAHFFGRGLVDPIDDIRDAKLPSHPEVLKLLAEEFTAGRHDLKHLIRCIVLTKAYQRTSRSILGTPKPDEALFAQIPLRPLSAEMLLASLESAYETAELLPRNPAPPRRGQSLPFTRKNFIELFNTNDPEGDPTEYTQGIPQLLHLMNAPAHNAGTTRIDKLLKANETPEKVIEVLYLATLSRRPTEGELKRKLELVGKNKTPRDGLNAVLWTLVNSAEFNLNH